MRAPAWPGALSSVCSMQPCRKLHDITLQETKCAKDLWKTLEKVTDVFFPLFLKEKDWLKVKAKSSVQSQP